MLCSESTGTSSLSQEMVGTGVPSATHSKEAVLPLITVTSSVLPAPSKPGGTEDRNVQFQKNYFFGKHNEDINSQTHHAPGGYNAYCLLLPCWTQHMYIFHHLKPGFALYWKLKDKILLF